MANVSSNNLTTLYSGSGVSVRPTSAYGNSNVVALLNSGTDGGNTVTNILATGNMTIGNITANSNVTADYFIGNFIGNVTGNVSNANYANYAGEAFDVNVSNVTGIGNIAVINLDGNVSNILHGNGYWGPESGNLNANYANFAGNVTISAQPNITSLGTLTTLGVNGTATAVNFTANTGVFTGNGNGLSSIVGANVTGYVANATHSNIADVANSVAVANVVGIGNIAVINLDGNVSNILHGNGYWGPESGNLNANYANFAGQVVDATQSNITLLGTLTDLYMSNANVHLGTNAGANAQGTNRVSLGVGAGGGGAIITAGYISYDAGNSILEVTSTAGIYDAMTISGTGFTGAEQVISVIDAGNLLIDPPVSTPSGTLSFNSGQRSDTVAIGYNAGYNNQQTSAIAIGNTAGSNNQFDSAIAIGNNAGAFNQQAFATAIGNQAGYINQAGGAFAMGYLAGSNSQGSTAIAIGANAGANTQGISAIGIGQSAGQNTQGSSAIAIGTNAGNTTQGTGAVAVGRQAGFNTQGANSVAIGRFAGNSGQGINSVAVGYNAGRTNQAANSIIINATGANLNQTTANTFTVKPVRNIIQSNAVFYNSSTGEISYDTLANNTSNISAGNLSVTGIANISGNLTSGNANLGNLAYANFLQGDGYLISNLTVSSGTQIVNGNSNVVILANSNVSTSVAGVANVMVVSNTGANVIAFNINNGNVELPTKQFNPNGITVGTTANTNLMANSSFVDVDYGNGQGDGNLALGKTQTYVKARGNATTIATASANDRIGRTNYMVYNGTSNVLAVSTHAIPAAINSNANAVTTSGQYIIYTGNPNGDQGNANALSSLNTYAFSQGGGLAVTAGAATGSGSYASFSGYGVTVGGNGVQAQGVNFVRYRGNRDSNLSVQAGDQLGSFGFLGYNGASIYSARSASLQGVVDSSYVTNATVITSGFKLTSVNTSNQNDFWFYSNGNARLGLIGGGNSTFQTNATVFVNNFDSAGNVANIAGNLNVVQNANITGNLTVTTTSNVANTQLNRFQETVYSIGSTSGTITPDFVNGSIQTMTLTGSITMNSLANAVAGRSMTLIITQGGSGSYTLTSSMLFSNGYKTLSPGVGAIDLVSVFYDGTNYYASLTNGYA